MELTITLNASTPAEIKQLARLLDTITVTTAETPSPQPSAPVSRPKPAPVVKAEPTPEPLPESPATAPTEEEEDEAAPTVTLKEAVELASKAVSAGRAAEVKAALAKVGAKKVSELKTPESLAQFVQELG